jgi:ribose/xylose/arabinose/galactoside ABC-type transport system permease subunit
MKRLPPVFGIAAAAVAVYFAFGLFVPQTFFTLQSLELLARQSLIVGIGATGMTLIIIAGGIDLSAGSQIALTTVVMGASLKSTQNPWIALAAGLLCGVASGALNGALAAWFKAGPFIVTLASMLALRGLAKGLAGEQTIAGLPDTWLRSLTSALRDDQKWMIIPPGAWAWLAVMAAGSALMTFTRFGRHVVAVGSSEATARLCGVPVEKVKVGVYALGGLMMGLAGAMQFSRTGIGDPTSAVGEELKIIAAVVIGGASLSGGEGTLLGAFFGALIMTTINMGCTQLGMPNWVQEIIAGLIILGAVGLDRWRASRLEAS